MGFPKYLPADMEQEFSCEKYKKKFPFLDYFEPEEIEEIEKIIGTKIHNVAFYEQAFTHSSYLQVLTNLGVVAYSNERLEFLGDALLEFVVSNYLFSFYLAEDEGYLSKIRAQFVNRHTLAKVANKIGLFEFLKASFAAERNEKSNEKMMSNIYEAVLAAIFLDSGLEAAVKFVHSNLMSMIKMEDILVDKNYKSILLELTQAENKGLPEYKVLDFTGPDHDRTFTVGVFIEGILIGQGQGKNKKTAEQAASQNALENIENM